MEQMRTKSRYSDPCVRCGRCCAAELCPVAEIAFPDASAPCQALLFDENGIASCGLLLLDEGAGFDVVGRVLGIGCGCSSPDADTESWQIDEFDRLSYIRMYGYAPS